MNSLHRIACRGVAAAMLLGGFAGSLRAQGGADSASVARSDPPPALIGAWEGEARTARWPMYFSIDVGRERSTLNVLGQLLQVEEIRGRGDSVRLRVGKEPKAIYLDLRIGNDQLTGSFIEGKEVLPFTLRRIPPYPKPRDRVEGWTQDISALQTRFLAVDRSFSADERARFLAALDSTRMQLPRLDDNQVIVRLASAIALANNGHSRLYVLRNAQEIRRLPIRVWWFTDGLYVVRTTPEYRRLLGCRITDIDGTPAERARQVVSVAFAGSESWDDYMSSYSLTSPEMLNGFGISPTADSIGFGVSGCAAQGTRAVVQPLPLVRKRGAVEAWWDLSPRHRAADREWAHVLDARTDSVPLYLKNPNDAYWFEYLPASGILYFHYNRSGSMPSESTEQFGERLLAAFDRHPVKAFVTDLRFNTGGNNSLAAPLMQKLQERTRGMRRFVITGRATFSAGIYHVATWSEAGGVTFVGEPMGDALDYWSEGGNIRLPYSGINAHFANGAHSYSPAPCPDQTYCVDLSAPSVNPIPASPSWDDYLKGRDPAMDAVRQALGVRREP